MHVADDDLDDDDEEEDDDEDDDLDDDEDLDEDAEERRRLEAENMALKTNQPQFIPCDEGISDQKSSILQTKLF